MQAPIPVANLPFPGRAHPTADRLKSDLARPRDYRYSPIDFGHGVVTGNRTKLRRFNRGKRLLQIPTDLSGKRILNIGSWDGYWALGFTRRGGAVTCLDRWDDPAFEQFQRVKRHFACDWSVQRMDVQDLEPDTLGSFDVVFCAGALYQLRYPLATLERLPHVTKRLLIPETVGMIPAAHGHFPMIAFCPSDKNAMAAGRHWRISRAATVSWMREALLAAGCVRIKMQHTPSFAWLKKLATNQPQHGRIIAHAYPD
ncbi:MAG: DUF1698 domain-containing protein [Nevskiaceae bacterium]|nr:MAG: DUF1698 domain-containing protein [Nevskiaceae bacterium]TBR74409.1 MAG: DUF1698 domain-containing protein [Nevskiaceae bacterium]